jgi:hypothetical protein
MPRFGPSQPDRFAAPLAARELAPPARDPVEELTALLTSLPAADRLP